MTTQRTSAQTCEPADRRLWQIAAVRDLALIGIVLFLIWFGFYLRAIFTPLLIALVLAYIFDPLITGMEKRWKVPRPLSILGLFALVLGVLGGLAVWLAPILYRQVFGFITSVPRWLNELAGRYDIKLDAVLAELDLESRVQALEQDPLATLMPTLKAVLAGSGHVADALSSAAGTATFVAVTVALIPLYFFFFAWRFWPMVRSVEPFIPASRRQRVVEVVQKMDRAVAGFVRGRLLISVILAVMYAVGFALCGVPYWLVLGLFGGVLSLVPFIGGAVWPLAVILKYFQMTSGPEAPGFEWMAIFLWPTVVFAVAQFLEGWVLTPWIGGKSVNLDTVTTLVVVFIGGSLGGMYGLLICIPVAACVKILMVEEVLPRMRQWARTG
jgi:predicted PurR-regulated permease PerM